MIRDLFALKCPHCGAPMKPVAGDNMKCFKCGFVAGWIRK